MSERPRTWAVSGVLGLLLGVFILYGIARSQSPYPAGGPSANSYAAAAAPQPKKPLAPGEIDTARSRVYVHVDKTGFGHEHGVEGLVKSGSLHLGAGQNAGAIEIDMGSFTADSDDARRYVNLEGSTAPDTRTEVTNNMLGTSVLDVKQYPTATFVVTSIQQAPAKRPNAPQQYQLEGNFTLHGKTQKITILAEAMKASGYTHVRGSFTIAQTDYGITPFRKVLGAVGVADRLTIWGDLWVADEGTVQP